MYSILLIEDDCNLSKEIKLALNKWQFNVEVLKNFENIMEEFISSNPHLVIMDINLPYFDGFYWCKKIREISKIPIIFLSSRDSNMDIIMAINNGGDDYINKPFQIDILIAKLNALLRRTYSYGDEKGHFISYKNVMLDIEKGILIYKDEKLELTKNELKILVVLMKNQRKIISRDKLMMSLWENDEFINDNALTVNINRLRTKIREIGIEEFIKTKKGLGYIIE
ncbi:response regulator [Clostridium sp. Marseille-Q7071]